MKANDKSNIYDRDWRISVAIWDKDRQARHLEETNRLIAEGWGHEAAEYLAYERIMKEDELP